ncbi:hypothetical protein E8F20_05885 [Pseudomonas sp. BN415]|nr:hypothetical protein [Pseudomonas sp. BN415]
MVQDIESIRRSFVQRLKDAAREADFPEWGLGAHLAKITGKTPKAVSKWLNCESMPDRIAMLKLADATKVRVEWLEYGEEPRVSEFLTTNMTRALVADLASGKNTLSTSTGTGKTTATLDLLHSMLATKAGKALSEEARSRLLQAAEEQDGQQHSRHGNVIAGDFPRPPRLVDGDVLIPQYDVRASMGHGQVPADYAEFVRNVVVSGPQLEKLGLEYTSPANLSIITGWGQSMAGTIEDKDPLIVDRGVTEFAGDGIYVLTWDDHLYIKRLQKADADHFDLISDNPKHKDRVVHVDEVTIHARVLYVWRGMKV